MKFIPTKLAGVSIIEPDVFEDERGAFVRAWMPDEFRAQGFETAIAQASLVLSKTRGTIRGMHYQAPPFDETKVIRVVHGAVFDVVVDLRPGSPTFRGWTSVELSAANRRMLYVPTGCAHGYQTLTDDAEVFYFVSKPYSAQHQRGVRWNDPAFAIDWPLGMPTVIHARDAAYPDVK